MNRRTWLIALLMVMVALWMAACSSDRAPEEPTAGPATNTASEEPPIATSPMSEPGETQTISEPPASPATPAADVPQTGAESPPATSGQDLTVAVETGSVGAELTVELPPIEGVFANAAQALEALDSYRFTSTFSFIGQEAGQPQAGSIEVQGDVVAPDRQRMHWQDLETGDQFELVQIGSTAWIQSDGTWQQVPVLVAEAMSQAVLVYAPAISWSGLYGELQTTSNYIGEDTINGIPAHHYASTYSEWGQTWNGELTGATGDVWIARDGYPVKYQFAATGVDEQGNQGSVTWTMELSDVNASISIEPPM